MLTGWGAAVPGLRKVPAGPPSFSRFHFFTFSRTLCEQDLERYKLTTR